MAAGIRNGWGFVSQLVGVASTNAGVNSVNKNVGVGAAIQATTRSRLAKLMYRIDLAPDVAAGTVASPTQFRLVVLAGSNNPGDVSGWQASQYPNGSHPELPTQSPLEVLYDQWIDVSAGDPGLNYLASIDFADAGPSIDGGAMMIVLLVPMITTMSQAIINTQNANAQLTLAAYGLGDVGGPTGGGAHTGRSIPRFDVSSNG